MLPSISQPLLYPSLSSSGGSTRIQSSTTSSQTHLIPLIHSDCSFNLHTHNTRYNTGHDPSKPASLERSKPLSTFYGLTFTSMVAAAVPQESAAGAASLSSSSSSSSSASSNKQKLAATTHTDREGEGSTATITTPLSPHPQSSLPPSRLHIIGGSHGFPVPLGKARNLLLDAVRDLLPSSSIPSAAPSSTTPAARFLRFEVNVSDVQDEKSALLWLRAQPERLMPRIFFRVPDRSLIMAGLGAAHCVRGPEELGAAYRNQLGFFGPSQAEEETGGGEEMSGKIPAATTYYGGGRFDPHYPKPSADWQDFGATYLVLPAVELIRNGRRRSGGEGEEEMCDNASTATTTTTTTDTSSDARRRSTTSTITPRRRKSEAEEDTTTSSSPSTTPTPNPTNTTSTTTHTPSFKLAVNLRFTTAEELLAGRTTLLQLLRDVCLTDDDDDDDDGDALLPAPTSCEEPSQFDAWHEGIGKALAAMKSGEYRKVVLARAAQFTFPRRPRPLDLVLRLRDHYGYLFCLQLDADRAFLGCTPEQLFRLQAGTISTEALAGTRPRGGSTQEDERLAAELMASQKDRFENRVTAESIEDALRPLAEEGHVERFPAFLLRLQHVQHICHKISARLSSSSSSTTSSSSSPPSFKLLAALHPTPAVAGEPRRTALQAIRQLEPFDRGFYAGPVGYLSPTCAEFAVAIRSVLIVRERAHVFAGAGIVPGSTAEGEWAEIGAKMANFVRMFPRPTPPLRSLPNIATLWATLVIEEMARNGVTHFIIAPGSRSTPLVTAAARHPHTTLMVHHDERGAGFYALGYARARGRPAAIIVTSGTAVANLLPAVVEAATDRVPILLLTADRPPEQRDCGANQTVAQPNMFQSFVRWSKDMPCPTHEVLASSLLSDVDYAVSMARGVDPGPVHLNFMLRENLAPEGGVVRDAAVPGLTSEWPDACLGNRRFAQWERSLQPYTSFPRLRPSCALSPDLLGAIHGAQRGLLVVGRLPQRRDRAHVRWLAQELQWPVFADMGSGLRCDPALSHLLVGPYEALLADPLTASALDPDVILQIGSPLVSKRLPKFMVTCGASSLIHVIPSPARRDPELAATQHVCSDVPTFVRALDGLVDWGRMSERGGSGLLLLLKTLSARLEAEIGEELGAVAMPGIPTVGAVVRETSAVPLNEPMVAYLVARSIPAGHGLFLSNSMPVRDVESFATASSSLSSSALANVAMNRGASGIDGILSTAMGYAAGLHQPVTLLVGDMACLHDLNALHALSAPPSTSSSSLPVTVVLVNNGGGGIFSFLPIARHADVFSPYFDSPHDLQFGPVTQAFGLPYQLCRSAGEFATTLATAQASGRPSLIEVLTDRAQNVRVHRQLGAGLRASLHAGLTQLVRLDFIRTGPRSKPSLLLLHGFLGCKEDWAPLLWGSGAGGSNGGGGAGAMNGTSTGKHSHTHTHTHSQQQHQHHRGGFLASDYDCLALDLPGHGTTAVDAAGATCSVVYSLPVAALAIIQLLDRLGIAQCAVLGYSMGGRLAAYLAQQYPDRVSALIMVSAHPGLKTEAERLERQEDDRRLAERLGKAAAAVMNVVGEENESGNGGAEQWDAFLRWWYSKPLWGRLAERSPFYSRMMHRRRAALARSEDPGGLVRALLGMSVARQPGLWEFLRGGHLPTLIVYGMSDVKYAALAEELRGMVDGSGGGGLAVAGGGGGGGTGSMVEVKGIDDAGHAVVVEKEGEMLRETTAFLRRHLEDPNGGGAGCARKGGGGSGVGGIGGGKLISKKAGALGGVGGGGVGGGGVGGMSSVGMGIMHHHKGSSSSCSLNGGVGLGSSSSSSHHHHHHHHQQQCPRVTSLRWTSFSLPLKTPMVLSSGPTMTHRRGLIVALQSDTGCVGVGEVSPLPGFSKETLPQAEQRLKEVAAMLRGRALPKVAGLGAWMEWVDDLSSLSSPMVASVRAGVEMALVHLLAQEYRVGLPAVLMAANPSGLLHTGQVCVNGLVLRSGNGAAAGGGSRKVKVGGRAIEEDVARVNALTATLAPGHSLRLDANQAWSLEEAVEFVQGLAQPDRIDYIEEPCQDPRLNPELYFQTDQRVGFALDEALACTATTSTSTSSPSSPSTPPPRAPLSLGELVSMAGVRALVLKPTVLGGLKVCLELHALASSKGLQTVVSSSFESSVGLAHLAVLASVTCGSGGGLRHTLHGLSTYDAFQEDETEAVAGGGEFARLVTCGGRSSMVDVLGCGELLDAAYKKKGEEETLTTPAVPSAAAETTAQRKRASSAAEEDNSPERAGREDRNGNCSTRNELP